ncbi:hypothetical protein GCM10011508_08040 [Flavobacterium lutivivi]|nr:hypothetical protein GCM10011508_08040 [Flavobacterium lutivivi]
MEKADENLVVAIMLLNCVSKELSVDQRFSEIPKMASKPITVIGTSNFLKLKISANKQKTPNDTIDINTCILLSIYYC